MPDGEDDDLCALATELMTQGDCVRAVELLENVWPRAVCQTRALGLMSHRSLAVLQRCAQAVVEPYPETSGG
jgi:hypothetical protein